MKNRLTGLIAAAHTPFDGAGNLHVVQIPRIVDQLQAEGVSPLYVCGSTGEGMSLTREERQAVAEAYVEAARDRLPVIVQVGHNSLSEARTLAAHAQEIGADAISPSSPSYFKPASVAVLADCMGHIAAAAPDTPFYYYHIPELTGGAMDMIELLRMAPAKVPTLAGMKYTALTMHEYQACAAFDRGRFDLLWGTDEMLLGALAVGARGAVGSTYNVAAPLYRRLIDAFEAGNMDEARRLQALSFTMVRELSRFPFHPALKETLGMIGLDCGPCRLPHTRLTAEEVLRLRTRLGEIGFFDWARPERAASAAVSHEVAPGLLGEIKR